MSWTELLDHYDDFNAALYKSRIIAASARNTLRDFPNQLPESQRRALAAELKEIGKAILDVAGGEEATRPTGPGGRASPERQEHVPLVTSVFMLLTLSMKRMTTQPTLKAINFERLLCEQELIVSIAQLEAFFGNCVREICATRPQAMCSGKPVTREEIIKAGSWEALVARLIEAQSSEFGAESLSNRVDLLREKYGLRLTLLEQEIAALDELAAVRNVVLHNGGRIDKEYLRRTRRDELRVNDLVPVDGSLAEKAYGLVSVAACDVLLAVAEKYFVPVKLPALGLMLVGVVVERRGLAPEGQW